MTEPTLPKPPRGYRLIATKADKLKAVEKIPGDKFWSRIEKRWLYPVALGRFHPEDIYARRIRASKGRVKK
jgi:hypothetical protein